MDKKKQNRSSSLSGISLAGLVFAAGAAIAAVLSGFGSHAGLWKFTTGFKILEAAVLCAGASSVIALVGFAFAFYEKSVKNLIISFIGLLLGLVVFAVPFSWYLAAKHLPKIHDITTDTENPPGFVAVLPLRKDAANAPEYGGPDIAQKQREAYPDIKPLMLDIPADKAFEKALDAAYSMSWYIVDADKENLRIEATDTTFWFGFRDDIVVRITPLDSKSRIDVRSESRVGLSDVGTNAARIRKYLRKLSKKG